MLQKYKLFTWFWVSEGFGWGPMIFLFTPLPPHFVQFQREKLNFVKPLYSWELAPLRVIVDHTRKNFYSAYLLKNRSFCLDALYMFIQPLNLEMTPRASVLVSAPNLICIIDFERNLKIDPSKVLDWFCQIYIAAHLNVGMKDSSWKQCSWPVKMGGLRLRSTSEI